MSANFEACREVLDEAEAAADPAEAHGILCGLLCARNTPAPSEWAAEVLGDAAASAACRGWFEQALAEAGAALESPDCTFVPLLPDDGRPIDERVAALGRWTSGFLYGIGLGGALEPEAARDEVLADFAELARLDPDCEADEDSERGYAELVEFLRVGVMLIRASSGPHGDDQEPI